MNVFIFGAVVVLAVAALGWMLTRKKATPPDLGDLGGPGGTGHPPTAQK